MTSASVFVSADSLDGCGRAYPRPQLKRQSWISLNGEWAFAFDRTAAWRHPGNVAWDDVTTTHRSTNR